MTLICIPVLVKVRFIGIGYESIAPIDSRHLTAIFQDADTIETICQRIFKRLLSMIKSVTAKQLAIRVGVKARSQAALADRCQWIWCRRQAELGQSS